MLLKISGEFFQGEQALDVAKAKAVAEEIKSMVDAGVKVACVVGAGNIFRGRMVEGQGFDSTTPHYVGMLGAVTNGVFLKMVLESIGVAARIESTLDVKQVTTFHNPAESRKAFEQGEVVILGGTGLPFVTTDTAAVIFSLELGVDAVLKGTHVDGVYDKDPHKYDDAKRYEALNYEQALHENVQVMDASAFALAKEHELPILVFEWKTGNALAVLHDQRIGTLVSIN